MTTKKRERRKLVNNTEITRVVELARTLGIDVAGLDVREDGVTVLAPKNQQAMLTPAPIPSKEDKRKAERDRFFEDA